MAAAQSTSTDLDTLSGTLYGELIRPEDPAYDDARSVWNGVIDKRPAAIARCTGVHDVRAALEFVRETGLSVSVRGGGHNVAGSAICEDGLVIDLSGMRAVRVDPRERTAWVQAGGTWADVDTETQAFGLATPGGVVSETGVAGLTLGGGIGHLRCAYGLTCDNLRAVDLVTVDGEFHHVDTESHPDLFWSLRGGGQTVGVVTGFEFDLHPVGPDVAVLMVWYPEAVIEDVLVGYREFVADAPQELSTLAFAGRLPDEDVFDADTAEPKIAILGCYAGDLEKGLAVMQPLRDLGTPLADFSGPMAYTTLQTLLDEDYPDGMRYYWNSLYLDGLPAEAIETIAEFAATAPSPLSTVDVWELGGAIGDVSPEESAYPARQAPYLLGVEANWEESGEDAANIEWVRECIAAMESYSDGSAYVNFPGFEEDRSALVESTFGDMSDRLAAVRKRYDPTGIFRSDG